MIKQAEDLYLIINLRGERYAFPLGQVQRLLTAPPVTSLPQAPPFIRGVIEQNGKTLELWDLRVLLGMNSAKQGAEQLFSMLAEMEREERDRLAKLERGLMEPDSFAAGELSGDSRLTAWLANFKARRSNALSGAVAIMQEVHDRLHGLVEQCLGLAAGQQAEAALQLLRKEKDGLLTELGQRFVQIRQVMAETQREIAVVFSLDSRNAAAAVDSVLGVEPLKLHGEGDSADWIREQCGLNICSASRPNQNGELVLVLDAVELLHNRQSA